MNAVCLTVFLSLWFALDGVAQGPKGPGGFADVPWGTSPAQAKAEIIQRTGASYTKSLRKTGGETLIFHGGNFAGRKVNSMSAAFAGGRLYRVYAYFGEGRGGNTVDEFKKDLSDKYGLPRTAGKRYRWEFRPSADGKDAESIELGKAKEVSLTYTNETMLTSLQKSGADLDAL
jgi:hypothetical protein